VDYVEGLLIFHVWFVDGRGLGGFEVGAEGEWMAATKRGFDKHSRWLDYPQRKASHLDARLASGQRLFAPAALHRRASADSTLVHEARPATKHHGDEYNARVYITTDQC
jgi:hypothetical protein